MLVALGVVVMLIYVVLRWVAQQTGIKTPGQHSLLRVCDRISLEPKKGIWVVEVAGQYLVLGTHEHGITLLDKLDPHTARQHMDTPSQQTKGGFWEWWKNRKSATASANTQAGETSPTPAPNHTTNHAIDSVHKGASQPSIPTHFEVVSDGQKTSSSTQK